MQAIPKAIALQLCEETQRQNRDKWYTFNGLWCWVCAAQARSDPSRLCFNHPPDYRGCTQVNRRHDAGIARASAD